MNVLARCYYRFVQALLRISAHFLDFSPRQLIQGEDALEQLTKALSLRHFRRPFVVVDPYLHEKGFDAEILSALEEAGLRPTVFDEVRPNPTIPLAEKAADKFEAFTCDCFIAIGGGSAIDLAKAASIGVAYPNKPLAKFKGLLKVRRRLPYLVAIPSTAGTGSETTVATILVDPSTKDKFQIDDTKLIPSLAVFYPKLLTSLPKKVIAETGMDALTHALEAYIGHSNTKSTRVDALDAIKGIHQYLLLFYEEPSNEAYALGMLKASYQAGRAFTRAYVGYVHALAHALGGTYNVGHGYANAVLLPKVLKAYGKKVYRSLAEISDVLELAPADWSKEEKARNLIAYIEHLNSSMGIPRQFDHLIAEEDLPSLARHAAKEGNPLYPVPKIFGKKELENILRKSDANWGYKTI